MIIIFNSHRAREKGERILGRTPQYYYSFYQETGRGCAEITEDEFQKIKHITGVRNPKRIDKEDLKECWSFK